jgi:hypothetical protein
MWSVNVEDRSTLNRVMDKIRDLVVRRFTQAETGFQYGGGNRGGKHSWFSVIRFRMPVYKRMRRRKPMTENRQLKTGVHSCVFLQAIV